MLRWGCKDVLTSSFAGRLFLLAQSESCLVLGFLLSGFFLIFWFREVIHVEVGELKQQEGAGWGQGEKGSQKEKKEKEERGIQGETHLV